jgi:hypothetical protein
MALIILIFLMIITTALTAIAIKVLYILREGLPELVTMFVLVLVILWLIFMGAYIALIFFI